MKDGRGLWQGKSCVRYAKLLLRVRLACRNSQLFQRLPHRKDRYALKTFHGKEIVVAGYNCIGTRVHRTGENVNVIRIAKRWWNWNGAAFDD